jgi:hypothetical protein
MQNEILPSGTWGLRSAWAKRLFLVGLAALAARQESGSSSPEKCYDLANIFGGEEDFLFFLRARTDPGQLIKNMNNEILLQSLVDARTFEDTTYAALFTAEAKKRKLKVPKTDATVPTGTTVKRKFSFDD